jgi:hypothetical protein
MCMKISTRPPSASLPTVLLLHGHGIASAFIRSSLRGYRELGVRRVEVEAEDDGRYAWARLGFSWPSVSAGAHRRAFADFLRYQHGLSHEDALKYSAAAERADTLAAFALDGRTLGRDFLLLEGRPRWKGSITLDPTDPGFIRATR